jgi:1-deoxy-D-xylulose-5-phosphate synthase
MNVPRILDGIEGPADLKGLTLHQLDQLAAEIRQEMIAKVTTNGGHLASNLGVVELTIALHQVFDSPRDKIVWDVGHQSYVHKLLTGRRQRFATLRQHQGLSGFTDRNESPHDPFGAGHASTAISAALGMAVARDLSGEDYHVVAVVGDGALSGGMAFEGLNQAGHLSTRLIIILNDNGMAISPNVGALSKLLNKVRLDHRYHRAKREAQGVFARLPLGIGAGELARRVKGSLKSLLLPTVMWEGFGLTYLGPIDGHNIAELKAALTQARDYSNKPLFLHVITTKGKGYPPAEEDASRFHGLPPAVKNSEAVPTYSEVFAQTVLRLARENPKVVAITAAMLEGTKLSSIAPELTDRIFDVGICEQHAVTFAAGLATQGFIPIVAIYSTFLQRAFDQIIHDVCQQDLPVAFALDRSGIVAEDGKTHQGTLDLSYLTLIPNIVVAAPKDENELQHLLYTAVSAKQPVVIRYPRGYGLGVPLDPIPHQIPIGQGEILREGADVAILAIGVTVSPALEAAQRLAEEGMEIMVVNARFAKPLDEELILEVAGRVKRLVTLEENALSGGFGSRVLELLRDSGAGHVQLECMALPDEFVGQGPQELLRSQYQLDAEGIVQRILASFPELAPRSRMETLID